MDFRIGKREICDNLEGLNTLFYLSDRQFHVVSVSLYYHGQQFLIARTASGLKPDHLGSYLFTNTAFLALRTPFRPSATRIQYRDVTRFALVLPPRFNTAREPAVQPGARRSQQGWKMVRMEGRVYDAGTVYIRDPLECVNCCSQ